MCLCVLGDVKICILVFEHKRASPHTHTVRGKLWIDFIPSAQIGCNKHADRNVVDGDEADLFVREI